MISYPGSCSKLWELSGNEELQSIIEELQTAKEELESSNEELATLAQESQIRNFELNALNDDLTNLLSSVQLPILMLDNDLHVRRFTPAAEKLLNLIGSDVGRPIGDINPNIEIPDLNQLNELTCEDGQGYFFSGPVNGETAKKMLVAA